MKIELIGKTEIENYYGIYIKLIVERKRDKIRDFFGEFLRPNSNNHIPRSLIISPLL